MEAEIRKIKEKFAPDHCSHLICDIILFNACCLQICQNYSEHNKVGHKFQVPYNIVNCNAFNFKISKIS
jgi:hypothetical protein